MSAGRNSFWNVRRARDKGTAPQRNELALLNLIRHGDSGAPADPAALAALRDALAGGPIEETLHPLIALVAARGDRLPMDGDAAGKLAGIRRRTWYRYQVIAGEFERLHIALREAGIAHMLIGDLAAALGIYDDASHRPVDTLAVLIEAGDFDRGMAGLAALGWKPAFDLPAVARAYLRACRLIHDRAPCELHLHCNVLSRFPCPEATRGCWQRAIPIRFRSCEVPIPGPLDQMLHTADRIWDGEPGSAALRYADAIGLAHTRPVDWPLLLAEAQRLSMVLPVAALLNVLEQQLSLTLPDAVSNWHRQTRAVLSERLEARYGESGFLRKLFGELPTLYFAWRRQRRAAPLQQTSGFPAFLREYWQRDSSAALAMLVLRLSARRLGNAWRE